MRATWDVLKAALGITDKDLAESSEQKPEAAAERLCANMLDASLLIVGHPSKLVDSEIRACRLTLVPIDGAKIDALVAAKPYYVKGVIPGADYDLADTPTFGGLTTLVTSADVPDDVVYTLTMTIMKNIDKLRQQPALSGLDPQKMATQSLTAPLHRERMMTSYAKRPDPSDLAYTMPLPDGRTRPEDTAPPEQTPLADAAQQVGTDLAETVQSAADDAADEPIQRL